MKTIIFDVDGVLINSKDEFGNYLWKKNIKEDLGISQDQVHQIYSDWSLVIKGLVDTRQYFETVFAKFKIDVSDDSISHVQAAAELGWTCHHYKNIEGLNNFIQLL